MNLKVKPLYKVCIQYARMDIFNDVAEFQTVYRKTINSPEFMRTQDLKSTLKCQRCFSCLKNGDYLSVIAALAALAEQQPAGAQ